MRNWNGTRVLVGMALVGLAGLGACGDDDNGNGNGNGPPPPPPPPFLSGTVCGEEISYRLGGDERIVVIRDPDGTLDGLAVLDGELFDPENKAAWAQYAARHDTFLVLGFSKDEPATPHTVTRIFDSFFAGRGVGVIGFEGDDARVEITAIDLDAPSIEVKFSLPVAGRSRAYPPDFSDDGERCPPTVMTGGFAGPVTFVTFDEAARPRPAKPAGPTKPLSIDKR